MVPKPLSQQGLTTCEADSSYGTIEQRAPCSPMQKKQRRSGRNRWPKLIAKTLLVILLISIIVVYVIFPLSVYFSSTLRRHLLFFEFLASSKGLSDPESFGINCSRNLFISSDSGIRLGTWYVQSARGSRCIADTTWFAGDSVTVLYLHGISGSRSSHNRVFLAKKLSTQMKTHVVSIDYRGFGDSTNELPSLAGVVADSLAAYKRLRTIMPNSKIIVWGHSLGTSVSVYLAAKLHEMHDDPAAIVLEAALDSVGNVIRYNRLSKFHRWLPWFDALITAPFGTDPATAFNSTAQVARLNPKVPILMLHSKDDKTIPFAHGFRLYRNIVKARAAVADATNVTFIPFGSEYGFGHSRIVFYEHLDGIVNEFLTKNKISA